MNPRYIYIYVFMCILLYKLYVYTDIGLYMLYIFYLKTRILNLDSIYIMGARLGSH